MSANYILEYSCTDAEMREARSLGMRQTRQARVVLIIYALFMVLVYVRIRSDVPPKYQPVFMAAALGLLLFFHFGLHSRKKPRIATKLELSEMGLNFLTPDSNVEIPWTAFGKRVESHNLFVLLDRPQRLIYAVPKRAFPNEEAVIWFRGCTDRISMNETATLETSPAITTATATDGVSITFELRYGDYLGQMFASWRVKGLFLLIYGIIFGQALYDLVYPPSHTVNSPVMVLLLVASPITAMMLLFLFGLPFLRVRAQRKHFGPQQVRFSDEEIQFSERDASGTLPWSSYRYFKETRHGFILWRPGGVEGPTSALFPKRAFAKAADLERTRELFNRKLRYSRWFF